MIGTASHFATRRTKGGREVLTGAASVSPLRHYALKTLQYSVNTMRAGSPSPATPSLLDHEQRRSVRTNATTVIRCLLGSAVAVGAALGASQAPAQLMPKAQQLGDFGGCLVRQGPKLAEKVARAPFDTPQERDAVLTLTRAHNSCVKGAVLSGRVGAIRGAVAQALLARQPALLDTLAAGADAPARRPAPATGRALVIAYATCLIDAAPARTAALLRTPVASAEERPTLLAYGETLKQCTPDGIEYRVDLPDLRNHLASIAYLRLAAGQTE